MRHRSGHVAASDKAARVNAASSQPHPDVVVHEPLHACGAPIPAVWACMNDDFELGFWTWYATDEHRLLLDACHGMKALDFLQSSSSVQSKELNCCPRCDIGDLTSRVEDFLRCVSMGFPVLERQLMEVLDRCNQLPDSALRWDDCEMFTDPAWEPVRIAASSALQLAGWSNLLDHVDEFLRNGVR